MTAIFASQGDVRFQIKNIYKPLFSPSGISEKPWYILWFGVFEWMNMHVFPWSFALKNEYACIPVTICISVFKQRPDEEAVVDQGGTSTTLNIHYEKEELEGKRLPPMVRENRSPLETWVYIWLFFSWLRDPVGKTVTFLCFLVLVLNKSRDKSALVW